MTQNEKDLLIKDLCARLPYKAKVQIENVSGICTLVEIDCNDDEMSVAVQHENGELNGYDFDRAKPYLFPISSMTGEQDEEFMIIPIGYPSIDWFNKNHFDYRGLIEKGLAIDATGLNIY